MQITSILSENWPPPTTHPRLFATISRWEEVLRNERDDPTSQRIAARLLTLAEGFLAEPPTVYEKRGGSRDMLGAVRDGLDRISVFSMSWRLTGDSRFLDGARAQMNAASALTDWNPGHFLDVAEMTLAFACGLDWLYEAWTPTERALWETNIIEKGLKPSLSDKFEITWWVKGTNNWNAVCHAGMVVGAIAVWQREPELARSLVSRAVENLKFYAAGYAPDGAYPEGPGYWNYGASFHVLLIAALETALGSRFGLDEFPGFLDSARYVRQMTTPTGLVYNYADNTETRSFSSALFWMARRLHQPELAHYEIENLEKMPARLAPFALLWHSPAPVAKTNIGSGDAIMPTSYLGRGINPVSVHRTDFSNRDSIFVGVKGGKAAISHGHMDAGSFIMESQGVRWAVELGMQPYNTLESVGFSDLWVMKQTSKRWQIFRVGPDSHNILRFDGAPQNVEETATIEHFGAGKEPFTIVELTPVYGGQIENVRRGVRLRADGSVVFLDEWHASNKSVGATWQWLTRSAVEVDGNHAILRQGGKTLHLHALAPTEASFAVEDVSRPQHPYDVENQNLSRLTLIHDTPAHGFGHFCVLAATDLRLVTRFKIQMLDEWMRA